MQTAAAAARSEGGPVREVDVLIVGAGISGIDAAYHLKTRCPGKTFAVLEREDGLGGTWRVHRYPGVRSDSDLYTFGYRWKPWTGVPLATGAEILRYLTEAVEEQSISPYLNFGQAVESARWDSTAARWSLSVIDHSSGERRIWTARFLWMCQGYYHHSQGYTPDLPGLDRFEGDIVHPQTWPEDLDYDGKRVVVIGSGATAATIVPAMAGEAAHVTMLQRSPTYFYPKPKQNELAVLLEPLDLPDEWTHEILRRHVLHEQDMLRERLVSEPDAVRKDLIDAAEAYLGSSAPVDPHFSPRYPVWRQRLAVVPDGDLFLAIRRGEASVVTDRIDTITETGITLVSGARLDADIIVTATGFNLSPLGGLPFDIDGRPLDFAQCWAHRGIMFSEVPNMAWIFGYLRASWTLRADLICDFVCRLLHRMDEVGAQTVVPRLRAEDEAMTPRALIEPDNFDPGYLTRSMHLMPRQGDHDPWIFNQDYFSERHQIAGADLDDGTLIFS